MKKICVFLLVLLCASVVFGQQQKVAVYVTGATEEGINDFVGAYLVDAIVKSSNYLAVERTADFLKELDKEQSYQRGGAVDDNELSRLGKQFGVQLVGVAKIGQMGDKQFVSARLIDVETATVKSSTKPVIFTLGDVDKSCATVALSLISSEPVDIKKPTVSEKNPPKQNEPKPEPKEQPVNIVPVSPPQQVAGGDGNVSLYFSGFTSGKNPIAKIYVDGVYIGSGTLHQGFSVSFPESYAGAHTVKIE
jgi:hypothetical protein